MITTRSRADANKILITTCSRADVSIFNSLKLLVSYFAHVMNLGYLVTEELAHQVVVVDVGKPADSS